MSILKLKLVPDETQYAVKENKSVVSTQLDGGRARSRLDLLNADIEVEVQFTLNESEYQYLRAFYNYNNKGADPFRIDLLLETPTLREHIAHFRPGTWKLTRVRGRTFVVRVTLEVQTNNDGLDYASIVTNFVPEVYAAPPDPPDEFGIEDPP